MLFTHGIYHYGRTGISVGLDAVRGTLEQRRASGLFEALDQALPEARRQGDRGRALGQDRLRLRAQVAGDGADGDLKGKKVRGTPAYHPLIRMLGGAPVVLPIPEVYTALEKGVIDGAASPVVGLLGVKWYEVAKYRRAAELRLHAPALPDEPRHLEQAVGRRQEGPARRRPKIEEVWYREYDRMAEEEIKQLVGKGVTISKLGPSQDKLNAVWSEGLWELAEKKSPEAKALHQLAKSKGITD